MVTVTILKIVAGSVQVTSSVAFTGADNTAAVAGQAALATVLTSGDSTAVFGSTFGTVAVSGVTAALAANPGESYHAMQIQSLLS